MKWLRLWVDEIIKGTTFDELSLSERGLWFSLLLLAGNSLTPGIVEMRKAVKYPQETLATLVNCDRKTLQKCLKKLISVGKISLLKDGRLAIVNWSKYQTRYEKYYKKENDEQKKDAKNNGIDMPGRKEEEKKKKEYKEIACRVINYLNTVNGSSFTHSERNLSYPIARLREGHTEEKLRFVINVKWNDPDFNKKYFRPSTLFNSDKFEGYLMEINNAKPKRFDEEDF